MLRTFDPDVSHRLYCSAEGEEPVAGGGTPTPSAPSPPEARQHSAPIIDKTAIELARENERLKLEQEAQRRTEAEAKAAKAAESKRAKEAEAAKASEAAAKLADENERLKKELRRGRVIAALPGALIDSDDLPQSLVDSLEYGDDGLTLTEESQKTIDAWAEKKAHLFARPAAGQAAAAAAGRTAAKGNNRFGLTAAEMDEMRDARIDPYAYMRDDNPLWQAWKRPLEKATKGVHRNVRQ